VLDLGPLVAGGAARRWRIVTATATSAYASIWPVRLVMTKLGCAERALVTVTS
jgi:hypothetical protein